MIVNTPNILAHTTNKTYLFVKLFKMRPIASKVDCENKVRKRKRVERRRMYAIQ